MTIDIETGRNAGIKTCAVTYGLGTRNDLTNSSPDFMIDSLDELTGINF